jgi:hypothetical protein
MLLLVAYWSIIHRDFFFSFSELEVICNLGDTGA